MQSYLDSTSMPDNAQGVVFAIAGSIKGFELFSCPQTFHALYPKLLKSYVMDAMEQEDIQFTKPQIKDARKLLEDTDSCVAKQCKAQGVGKLFIINSSQLQATVLMLDGVIVHFTCFSKRMQGEL